MMAGALLHIVVLIGGPEWIRFVGAPESVVASARAGTWLAPVSTIGIAFMLMLWGLYAFAAAGRFRPLPLMKTVVGVIAAIFLIRGLLIVPLLPRLDWSRPYHLFVIGSSLFILALGLAYAIGLLGAMRRRRASAI